MNSPGWRRLALLLLAAIVMRAIVIGDPVVHVDEEFYFTAAHAMAHGALPFVDVWDRKPVGLFLLYLPAAALGPPWGIYAYQLMALVALVGTAWLIARLATRAGWAAGATLAALAYVAWPDLLNGVGGQSPIFYNLPMAGAASLIVAAGALPRRRLLGAGAMALVGLALQLKYSVVFEGIFFGLWLLGQEWRMRRSVPTIVAYAALLVGIALLPTAAALAAYAAAGHADAFLFANFGSIGHRNADPLGEALGNAGTLVLLLSPVVAMAAIALREQAAGDPPVCRFLALWLLVAIAAVVVFGTWFDHYGLPVLVPGLACAAGFFAAPRRRRLGWAILAVVAAGGLITAAINRANRGTAAQFAALSHAVGRGPGCLWVYSGSTMLYTATRRCTLSRYWVPAHLNRTRESGATGVDQAAEVRRILALDPAVVVMRPPFRGERADIRAIVLGEMRRRYRLAATLPMGREAITVYRR